MSCSASSRRWARFTWFFYGCLFALVLVGTLGGCSAVEAPASAAEKQVPPEIGARTVIVDGTTRCVVVGHMNPSTGRLWPDTDLELSCDWKPPATPPPAPSQRSPYPLEPDQQPGRVVVR